MKTTKHYSPEVRERAVRVRMFSEHQGEYGAESTGDKYPLAERIRSRL